MEIKSFKQFVGVLQQGTKEKERTVINTADHIIVVLDNKGLTKADTGILKRYSIPAQYSADVAGWLSE
ncbi:MAG: hypothetical protein GXP30_01680 [Verrucomicrobia bacterium]|nr:hypothetical protein [Verrucomicrobiota bacterium]